MNKTLNIVMTVAAAAVLVALNVGVFMAAGNGAISPINNIMLWGGFVALNVASILWAISLLGLQPLVVAISYVAGGTLAFLGVRGMSDVSVAEITTAGATYGAFGALAIGNATTKVRLAFFNKGQVPFIFIIAGLLVVDAVLNSQVSSAGGGVLLNAVLLPFAIAGVALGTIWSLLNRFGIGKTPNEKLAALEAAQVRVETVKTVADKKVVIPMPEREAKQEVPSPAPAKKIERVEPIAPAAKAAPAPVVEPQPIVAEAPVEEVKDEPFFPLEIDKNDDFVLPAGETEREESMPAFEMPTFDAALYASGSQDHKGDGGVMVKAPPVSVEAPPVKVKVEEPAPAAIEAKPEPAEKKEDKGNDWLGGHLDLLNKLK